MAFYQGGSVKYYKFASLETSALYHAVFTRHGGFSPSPWKSLNFGASVGDRQERVQRNREKALEILNINPLNIYDTYQVHSSEIIITDHPLAMDTPHIKADGIITNRPGISLLMRFADCVPIILFDPVQHAVGIAHAGWIGTVNKIASRLVSKMQIAYGTKPSDLLAAIGPSIGPDHYQVGGDVIEKVKLSFPDQAEMLIQYDNKKTFLDLWKANQVILNNAGVNHIEVCGICTNCHLDDWYSHRGEKGKTGRFGVVVGLN